MDKLQKFIYGTDKALKCLFYFEISVRVSHALISSLSSSWSRSMMKTGPVMEQVSPVSESSENPDPDLFYELRSTKTIKLHQILDPAKSDLIYTIKEHETPFSPNKPDIKL